MTEVQAQIAGLERQLADAKKVVAQMEMAHKLHSNREFRKLILEEFCVNECARYARASADPALSDTDRANSMALAQAAGHLMKWLSVQTLMGNTALREITQVEEALEEVRAEAGE